jgi:predicted enzyme related to lactoylglutathione lyase
MNVSTVMIRQDILSLEELVPKLAYVIVFVSDMDRAVKFYRDTMGLPLKFSSPHWSEFVTGETTLALHPESAGSPAGAVHLGFNVPKLETFYQEMTDKGVKFSQPPTKQDFGGMLATFEDSEGGVCTVSGS